MKNFKFQSKGFTLLEAIIAISVLVVGIVGVYGWVAKTIGYTSTTRSKLIATYLCQEGIEIVRNIRDTNWLEGDSWDDGLDAGDWEADYTATSLSTAYTGNILKIDNGFYKYSGTGTSTRFKRKITISDKTDLDDPPDGNPDKMKITVEVSWKPWGANDSVTGEEYLYDWQ